MKKIIDKVGKFRLFYIIWIIAFFIYLNYPFDFIYANNNLNIYMPNNNEMSNNKKCYFTTSGFMAKSEFRRSYNGYISIDSNNVFPKYQNLQIFNIFLDGTTTIESIAYPNSYDNELHQKKDKLIFTENFKNIVICQIENNVCLFDEDNYILSTFDSFDETTEFVNRYFMNNSK